MLSSFLVAFLCTLVTWMFLQWPFLPHLCGLFSSVTFLIWAFFSSWHYYRGRFFLHGHFFHRRFYQLGPMKMSEEYLLDYYHCWVQQQCQYFYLLLSALYVSPNCIHWLLWKPNDAKEYVNYCDTVECIRMTWWVPAAVPQMMKLMKHTVMCSLLLYWRLSTWLGEHFFIIL